MNTLNLNGIIPAVIVPMRQDYSIDFEAYRNYLEWVIAQRPVGLAVNVDTGEGPYLTPEERREVIHVTREVAAGRCIVVAGVGGPSTLFAAANAKAAREAGADAGARVDRAFLAGHRFSPQTGRSYVAASPIWTAGLS